MNQNDPYTPMPQVFVLGDPPLIEGSVLSFSSGSVALTNRTETIAWDFEIDLAKETKWLIDNPRSVAGIHLFPSRLKKRGGDPMALGFGSVPVVLSTRSFAGINRGHPVWHTHLSLVPNNASSATGQLPDEEVQSFMEEVILYQDKRCSPMRNSMVAKVLRNAASLSLAGNALYRRLVLPVPRSLPAFEMISEAGLNPENFELHPVAQALPLIAWRNGGAPLVPPSHWIRGRLHSDWWTLLPEEMQNPVAQAV